MCHFNPPDLYFRQGYRMSHPSHSCPTPVPSSNDVGLQYRTGGVRVPGYHSEPGEHDGGSAPLRIFLLGGFRVERNGHWVPLGAWARREAARVLVKLLATTPGHRLHREQVLDLLWPDVDVDA